MSRVMWAFAVACLIYAAAVGWMVLTLPDGPIPMHWSGVGGAPADEWSDRTDAIGFTIGFGVLLAGMYGVILWLIGRGKGSMSLVNFPHKDYWTRPENLPHARRLMLREFGWFAVVFMLWFATMPLSIAQAAHDPQARMPVWSELSFLVWVLFTIWWIVRLYRVFRIPPDDPSPHHLRPMS